MNYCNCPNCRTENCPAATELAAEKDLRESLEMTLGRFKTGLDERDQWKAVADRLAGVINQMPVENNWPKGVNEALQAHAELTKKNTP